MKKSLLFALLVSIFSCNLLFAEINLISPIQGQWANKQMLVIDNSADGDYFYSIDGSDPEKFGFVYDGPVYLDMTGNVTLKVVHIAATGKKESATVDYSVTVDSAYDTSYRDFVKTFIDSGIINYSAGAKFVIPENLVFSLGFPPDSFIKGTTLSVSSNCALQRTVPCVVWDKQKNIKYRFVIKIFPQSAGDNIHREVPFSIKDWETISFNDRNKLYKIDSEYWSLPVKPRTLDRSVSHMLSWQDLDYKEGNPIEFLVLPPKPELEKHSNVDGSFIYSINGDEVYTLSFRNNETGEYSYLYSQIGADCFTGDRAYGNLDIGIFANGVYQGSVIENYKIDKRPPVLPELKTTAKAFYSNEKVSVEITAEKDCELYYAVSEPTVLDKTANPYTVDSEVLTKIPVGEFKLSKSNSFSLSWGQKGNGPAYYKVQAYSKSGNNVSQIIEYSAIVDQLNYYYDSSYAGSSIAEGTAEHPFTTFEQCVKGLRKNITATMRVKGNIIIDKEYELPAKVEIINEGDGNIIFRDGGSIVLKGANVKITDFTISNGESSTTEEIVPFFKLENAVLDLNNCLIDANFAGNGTVIDSYNSILNIENSIAAINAVNYSSLISSVKSRITIDNSSVSANGDTCVLLSATNGNVSLNNNNLSVTGNSLRIAELYGVKAEIIENKYKVHSLIKNNKQSPIYVNKSTSLVEKNNIKNGY